VEKGKIEKKGYGKEKISNYYVMVLYQIYKTIKNKSTQSTDHILRGLVLFFFFTLFVTNCITGLQLILLYTVKDSFRNFRLCSRASLGFTILETLMPIQNKNRNQKPHYDQNILYFYHLMFEESKILFYLLKLILRLNCA